MATLEEINRLKPFLDKEARDRDENLCIFYNYDTCKTEYMLYSEARDCEEKDEGYIVLVSFQKPLEARSDVIMAQCKKENRQPNDEEIDELCEWILNVKKDLIHGKN